MYIGASRACIRIASWSHPGDALCPAVKPSHSCAALRQCLPPPPVCDPSSVSQAMEPTIAIIMFFTVASYMPITIIISEWRGKLRREVNRTDQVQV